MLALRAAFKVRELRALPGRDLPAASLAWDAKASQIVLQDPFRHIGTGILALIAVLTGIGVAQAPTRSNLVAWGLYLGIATPVCVAVQLKRVILKPTTMEARLGTGRVIERRYSDIVAWSCNSRQVVTLFFEDGGKISVKLSLSNFERFGSLVEQRAGKTIPFRH